MTTICDVSEGQGMDRDSLNKAYEAYRNASIEKDNAKKELKQKTEQFEQYTQQLKRKIEEQEKIIAELKAQLSSEKHVSEEVKCEAAHRKQERERLSPSIRWPGNPSTSHRTNHILKVPVEFPQICSHLSPGDSTIKSEEVLDLLQEIQGTFQRIHTLTRRQKDHLKRIHKGNDAANEQAFSMPIQCTDDTAEQTDVPSRTEANDPVASGSLASRGVSPVDVEFMDGIKFPPSADSEYDFLHSAPDRTGLLTKTRKRPERNSTVIEESFSFTVSSPPSDLPPTSASHEGVRGPQQPLWSPDLSDVASEASSVKSDQAEGPNLCQFCKVTVPADRMYRHLNSHFKSKAGD